MAHLCALAVFMFYALKSDFHLHRPSLMPSLHQRCGPGIVSAHQATSKSVGEMGTNNAPSQLDEATQGKRGLALTQGWGRGQQEQAGLWWLTN